jgi:hypothetical protein
MLCPKIGSAFNSQGLLALDFNRFAWAELLFRI